jgi:CBS domain containing-hemolysin-like protein
MDKEPTAKDVMNPTVLTVPIDLTAAELADFFAERQITGAPVVDEDGTLVGVVSLMDLAESHAGPDLPIGEIMTPAVYSVRETTPVSAIARTMVSGRVHRLLVTRRGRAGGIVTTMDLLPLLWETQRGHGAAAEPRPTASGSPAAWRSEPFPRARPAAASPWAGVSCGARRRTVRSARGWLVIQRCRRRVIALVGVSVGVLGL